MMIQKLKCYFVSENFRSLILCVIVLMLAFNFYDRRVTVREINQNLDKFQTSRTMLNSRAQIQIILCNAALEGRRLNAEEIGTVKRLWSKAEYDRAHESENQ